MSRPEIQYMQVKFDLKASDKTGRISGMGAVFGNIDEGFDVIHPGAFTDSLKRQRPLMLWQHGFTDDPVGVWDSVEETDEGLAVEGTMVLVSDQAKQRHALLKAGALNGLSIGYTIDEARYDDSNVRHLFKLDLWEVSVVNFPMNREARISAVKGMAGYNRLPTPRQTESLLRDAGWSPAQAKALITGGYEGLKAEFPDRMDRTASEELLVAINAARGIL